MEKFWVSHICCVSDLHPSCSCSWSALGRGGESNLHQAAQAAQKYTFPLHMGITRTAYPVLMYLWIFWFTYTSIFKNTTKRLSLPIQQIILEVNCGFEFPFLYPVTKRAVLPICIELEKPTGLAMVCKQKQLNCKLHTKQKNNKQNQNKNKPTKQKKHSQSIKSY